MQIVKINTKSKTDITLEEIRVPYGNKVRELEASVLTNARYLLDAGVIMSMF